jgi:hypothetical protein
VLVQAGDDLDQGGLAGAVVPEGATGRMVGGDHHQPAVLVEQGGGADATRRRLGDRLRVPAAGLQDGAVAVIEH